MAKVKINPEKAQELLANNAHNRKVTLSRVKEYASEMRNGMWAYNGEAIIVSVSGRLLDGQHRLLAVIEANVEIETELVEGVPDAEDGVDTFLTINTKNRSNVDALTIAGFKDRPQHIAKLMSLKETFDKQKLTQKPSGMKLLNHEVVELARAFGEEEALDIIERAERLALRCDLLTINYWILMVYVFRKLDDGNAFLEQVAECQGGRDGDPVSALLKRLEDFRGMGSSAINKAKWVGMFKAYDAKRKNEEIRIMRLSHTMPLTYPANYPDYQE